MITFESSRSQHKFEVAEMHVNMMQSCRVAL